jgi:diguanylate cyclase (GGDEF)-like protein
VSFSHASVRPAGAGNGAVAAAQPRINGQLRLVRPAHWALWERTRLAIVYVLGIDLAAVVVIWLGMYSRPIERSDVVWFGVLMACNVLYTEASRPIERIREHYAGGPHIDLNSVWMFAAVVLIHPTLAAAVIAVSYGYRWLRVRHHVVHRQTFSAAATVVSGYIASSLITHFGGTTFAEMDRTVGTFALVVGVGALFMIVIFGLIAGAIALTAPNPSLRTVLSSPGDYALEGATIALGLLLAWALVDWPIAGALIIGITLVLHRNVLIRQLREKARTDPKTGLLNAAGWSTAVDAELTRAARAHATSGLLVIDLDHFKAFNDAHGHLAGDDILRAVANTISAEVRAYDIVGRFGGEEFVVLLPGTSDSETIHVAERIRRRIAALPLPSADDQLTVSIGVAVCPQHAETLDDLLHCADMAMYAAKAAGRNRVHIAAVETAVDTAVNSAVDSANAGNGTGSVNGAVASSPLPLNGSHPAAPNGSHPAPVRESNAV